MLIINVITIAVAVGVLWFAVATWLDFKTKFPASVDHRKPPKTHRSGRKAAAPSNTRVVP